MGSNSKEASGDVKENHNIDTETRVKVNITHVGEIEKCKAMKGLQEIVNLLEYRQYSEGVLTHQVPHLTVLPCPPWCVTLYVTLYVTVNSDVASFNAALCAL